MNSYKLWVDGNQNAIGSLLEEIERIDAQKGRVYSTHVRGGGLQVNFVTTSKELHLELGRLSDDSKHILGYWLQDLFKRDGSSSFVFQMRLNQMAVLVTKTETPAIVTFTLSPAH